MAYKLGKVCGDYLKSAVIAFTHCEDLRIMFRFSRNDESHSCLGSRIVASYFGLSTTDPSETFPDYHSRSRAIWTSIAPVWEACARSPFIRRPEVVVDMFPKKWPGEEEQANYEIIMARVTYDDLVNDLLPLGSMFEVKADGSPAYPTIDYADLIYAGVPITTGRGESEVVQLPCDLDTLYVFKGVTLASALIDGTTDYSTSICYNEIRTVLDMSPHPNIKRPADIFVTTTRYEPNRESVVCGTLYPFMKNRSLADAIKKQLKLAKPTWSLHKLAKWCSQLASAVAHAHLVAKTYHMDLKPSNILVDDNEDLILIDWEQSGATIYMRAPEFNRNLHFQEATDSSGSTKLVYKSYNTLPTRRKSDTRDTVEIWRDKFPTAIEKAEVYSLGRTMWLLLTRLTERQAYHIWKKYPVTIFWRQNADDVPKEWKDIIGRCVSWDPYERIGLKELHEFWDITQDMWGFKKEMESILATLESVALS